MFERDYDVTEQAEIEIYRLGREISATFGAEVLADLALRMLLPEEEKVRAKYGDDSAAVTLLDEYHERVRLGLREPLV